MIINVQGNILPHSSVLNQVKKVADYTAEVDRDTGQGE
jgi:hypothetical protein